jgi:hypothetical protein
MILRLLKGNNTINVILIPLLGIIFWFGSILSPEVFPFYEGENSMPLYRITGGFLQAYPLWSVLAGLFLTILNSFLVVKTSIALQFLRSRSFLPGVIYIILVSTFKSNHSLHPTHIATSIILLVISNLLTTYQGTDSVSDAYKNSFFIAVASLFYLPAAVLLPLVWISNYTLQKGGSWRHIVVPVFGFLSPWIITIAVMFLLDITPQLFSDFNAITSSTKPWQFQNLEISVPIAYFLFISVLGSLSIVGGYDEKKISSRRILSIYFWMTLLLIGANLLLKFTSKEILILISIPFSYFISHYFLFAKNRFFPQLLFTILLLITVLSIFAI